MYHKVLKVTGWLLLLLLTILVGGFVAIQSPAAQTYLVQKVTQKLQDKMDADISIGKIHVRPLDYILIEDVLIKDPHPYYTPESVAVPQDTVLCAGLVKAQFSLSGLLRRRGALLRDVSVERGLFALVTEPNRMNNLTRILGGGPPAEKPDSAAAPPAIDPATLIARVADLRLEQMEFRLVNMDKPMPTLPGGINWTDLSVRDIHLRARDVTVTAAPLITGIVDELSFTEKSGMVMRHISGVARVGGGAVQVSSLTIRDDYSDLKLPEFAMIAPLAEYSDFLNKVRFKARIAPSHIDLRTINYFAPTLYRNTLVGDFETLFDGPIADFRVDGFHFRSEGGDVTVDTDGRIHGLPFIEDTHFDFELHRLDFTTPGMTTFIKGWAPDLELDFGAFVPWERFTLSGGTTSGTLNEFRIRSQIHSAGGIGDIEEEIVLHDIINPVAPMRIGGTAGLRDLDLGRFLGVDALQRTSLRTALELTLPKGGSGRMSARIDSLEIEKFGALGYNYSGLRATGSIDGDAMALRLVSHDPALGLILQAETAPSSTTGNTFYRVSGKIPFLDLRATGLLKEKPDPEGSVDSEGRRYDKNGDPIPDTPAQLSDIAIAGDIRMRPGPDGGDTMSGFVELSGIKLTDAAGTHDIGHIRLSSRTETGLNRMRLDASFAEATFTGSAGIDKFIPDLLEVTGRRHLPALFAGKSSGTGARKKDGGGFSGDNYQLDVTLHDTKDILGFFAPGTYIAPGTTIGAALSPEGVFTATASCRTVALGVKGIRGLDLGADNRDGVLSVSVEADSLNLSPLSIRGPRVLLTAREDDPLLNVAFDNREAEDRRSMADVGLKARLRRSEADSLLVDMIIDPSVLAVSGQKIDIVSDTISLDGGRIRVDGFKLESGEMFLGAGGAYSTAGRDTLSVAVRDLDLALVSRIVSLGLDLGGKVTGDAQILSTPKAEGGTGMLASLLSHDTSIGGKPLGDLAVESSWDNDRDGFVVGVRNDLRGRTNIDASAFFIPDGGSIDGHVRLDSLQIGYFAPFLETVFSQMEGTLSGDVGVGGTLSGLALSSQGLQIDDAILKVGFTNVPYRVSGPVSVGDTGVSFDDVRLVDPKGNRGKVTGGIHWDRLKDFKLGVEVEADGMQVLDMPQGFNPVFWGDVSANAHVGIAGPLQAINLSVDAQTVRDGTFHLPLGGSAAAGTSNLLTFREPPKPKVEDPYEMMLQSIDKAVKTEGDISIQIAADVSQGIEAYVEIDQNSGSGLTGRGTGHIEVELRPAAGLFNLGGSYTLTSGNFHLDLLGMTKRDFAIQDGSSIHFGGAIMDADLDITALYNTKASISTLIADSTATSRRPVICSIAITGKLANPSIAFGVEVPDLDPATQNLVDAVLSNPDQQQKQFLSLLLSGAFLPDSQSGIFNNTTVLSSTVTEIITNQVSSILQKLNIPVDVGLGYSQSAGGSDIFDVAVSTELFNNRVIVNGTIGNKHAATGSSSVVGDLDIELKLDPSGAFRLSLFSHSADQYTNYLDNSQRNGIGLTYQKEFNSGRELGGILRDIFASKKKRQERAALKSAQERSIKKNTIEITR